MHLTADGRFRRAGVGWRIVSLSMSILETDKLGVCYQGRLTSRRFIGSRFEVFSPCICAKVSTNVTVYRHVTWPAWSLPIYSPLARKVSQRIVYRGKISEIISGYSGRTPWQNERQGPLCTRRAVLDWRLSLCIR
jgi:hypothetical protein